MAGFLSWALIVLAGGIAVPTITLGVEILSGLRQSRTPMGRGNTRPRLAVLVPAHNEAAGIALTLDNVKAQLRSDDVLLVVADNCTDDTAALSRAAGAQVVERYDLERIGKGFALDFGIRHLAEKPPDIVVMVDADCELADGSLDELASACLQTGRPIQALYLMTAPPDASINRQIAEFAWRVKNWVRPLGLRNFGLPCQLMGTGMAFPWRVIQDAELATGSIVEDLQLGLDLAASGHAPVFCPAARVTSQFATTTRGENIQRQRWEHGHIATILRRAPHLFYLAMSQADLGLFALTLDLVVPPLSLLAILLVLSFTLTFIAALIGLGATALIISAASIFGFAATVGLAWSRYGRDVLPPSAIAAIPGYVFRKLGLYRSALFGKITARWIGTDRAKS